MMTGTVFVLCWVGNRPQFYAMLVTQWNTQHCRGHGFAFDFAAVHNAFQLQWSHFTGVTECDEETLLKLILLCQTDGSHGFLSTCLHPALPFAPPPLVPAV